MEIFRALGALAEPPSDATPRLTTLLGIEEAPTAAEYTSLFLRNLYPYASVYLGPEGMLGGEGRDRIAGFWRALGMTPPGEPDHLALMLAQYATLAELALAESDASRRVALGQARDAFLWEHLLSWLPPYLDKLAELAPPSYAAWGRTLDASLAEEARRLDVPRRELPLALRPAEGVTGDAASGTDAGVDEILAVLLAPARSGMILVHADLARAARALGLGLRIGERRFVLRALLSQAPDAVIEWIRVEARAWAERHAERGESLGAVAAAWEARAWETVQLADTLLATLVRHSTRFEAGA